MLVRKIFFNGADRELFLNTLALGYSGRLDSRVLALKPIMSTRTMNLR
jgi:hypothetical protein